MKKIIFLLVLLSFNVFAKPVNVNSADAKTLSESLQGIGQKKAEAIVQYRTENDAFESLNDLTKVKGIGEKTVEKNSDDILFSDPVAVKKSKKEKKAK
jgi:competence protein ComEA